MPKIPTLLSVYFNFKILPMKCVPVADVYPVPVNSISKEKNFQNLFIQN